MLVLTHGLRTRYSPQVVSSYRKAHLLRENEHGDQHILSTIEKKKPAVGKGKESEFGHFQGVKR